MGDIAEQLCKKAEINAKKILKNGDRVRCTKCPGRKRVFTFSHFDGCWMVSKSGINDYHPINVDLVNGVAVDFQHDSKLPVDNFIALAKN
jgi:hypothetical protein